MRTLHACVAEYAVGTMSCPWTYGDWLVNLHGLAVLGLVLWELLHPCSFKLLLSSILLGFNVDVLFPRSLAISFKCALLPCRLADSWEGKALLL